MYENRKYIIFSTSELNKVNFDEVLETGFDTVRLSVDGTQTFVKWDQENNPSFIEDLEIKSQIYSHSEILEILNTEEWVLQEETPLT